MASEKLVDPEWLEAHLDDPNVRILEFNWTGTDSYDTWHIPGAQGWFWKDWLWDDTIRDFPSPELFAKRCAAAGISNDTTVVCYGEPPQWLQPAGPQRLNVLGSKMSTSTSRSMASAIFSRK